jgi:hypothetical protein
MADEPETTPAPAPAPGPAPAPAPAPSHTPPNGPGPGQQLLEAINALPERLVHAIQESAPKPTKQSTPPPASTKDSGEGAASTKDKATPDGSSQRPGKKTLAQWWFGG